MTKATASPSFANLFGDLTSTAPIAATAASPAGPGPVIGKFQTDENYFFGRKRAAHGPLTPSAESIASYRYDPKTELITKAFVRGRSPFFVGPTGCGKSTFAMWLSYQLGLPYLEITHDAQFEIEDVIGKPMQMENGQWCYQDGALTDLFAHGGTYNADELPAIKPAIAQHYHPFINGKSIYVRSKGGRELITRHEDFRFIATGNPWSTYAGNYEPGFALLDRFLVHEFDYLDTEAEADVLVAKAPSVSPGIVRDLVAFADQWRRGVKANPDASRYNVSTRKLSDLVELMEYEEANLADAVKLAVLDPVRIQFPEELPNVKRVLCSHVSLPADL